MGAVLAAQQAQQEEERRKKAAEEAAATAAAAAAKAAEGYHPPWAPPPLAPPTATMPAGSNGIQNHSGAPLMITGGPAAAFHDGFNAVPQQFTSNSVASPNSIAHQLGWVQSPAPVASPQRPAPAFPQSTRPLQPHELRAQQLMMNGIDQFNAHASLVAVKQGSGQSGIGNSPMRSMNTNSSNTSSGYSNGAQTPQSQAYSPYR